MTIMEIKIIFDKAALNKKIHTGWGFSVLVDNKILFDTGEKGEWLIENLGYMNVAPGAIEGIVISHDHWDHTGGLCALLRNVEKGMSVHICPHFSADIKKKIRDCGGKPVETGRFQEIAENIHVTGEILGDYKGSPMPEQALVLHTEKGISVITGCAHPGILRMLDLIKNAFPKNRFYLVAGGFHLLDEDRRILAFILQEFKNMGVEMVAPSHCSGPKAEAFFAKEYRAGFVALKAGQTLNM